VAWWGCWGYGVVGVGSGSFAEAVGLLGVAGASVSGDAKIGEIGLVRDWGCGTITLSRKSVWAYYLIGFVHITTHTNTCHMICTFRLELCSWL
jgi:hypothetical protein